MMDPEERKRRLLEKAMRQPLNDVILNVQKGYIDINDLYAKIDERVREKANG